MPDRFGLPTVEEIAAALAADYGPTAPRGEGFSGSAPMYGPLPESGDPRANPLSYPPLYGMEREAFPGGVQDIPHPVEVPGPRTSPGGGFGERFGMALAQNPVSYQPRRGSSDLEDFVGGLLAGGANAYGGSVARGVGMREKLDQSLQQRQLERTRRNFDATERARTRASEAGRDLVRHRYDREKETRENAEYDRRRAIEQKYDLERDARRSRGSSNPMTSSDAEDIAEAIIRGDQPPVLTGLYRNAGPVRAVLARRKYDFTKAVADYDAMKRHYASVNGTIQVRLRQAAENARGSVDVARELNNSLKDLIARSNIEGANKGLLWLAKNAGSTEAAAAATQLQGQISALQSELSNVYQGGGVPTDEARRMAQSIIRADMSPRNLDAALDLALRDIGVRLAAVRDVQPISPSNPMGGTVVGGRDLGNSRVRYKIVNGELVPE